MEKIAYTYALAKSICEREDDYLDCFWPFAMKVLPKDSGYSSLQTIQDQVRTNFQLNIPLHTLSAIIHRAEKRKLLKQFSTGYQLTQTGSEYLDRLESESEAERRLNALYADITQFLSQRLETAPPQNEIENALISLVQKNIEPLAEFFGTGEESQESIQITAATTSIKNGLVKYIELAEREKPEHRRTLQDIFCGSVITTVLNIEDPQKISKLRIGKFKRNKVYFDTNFVFSLLGLDPPEFSAPARELYNLLIENGFELKVFSFTVDEICKVINGYIEEEYRYPTSIRVYSFYSSLKGKGWDKTNARDFITKIEDTLSNKKIQVEWLTDIDLNDYDPPNSEHRGILEQYKPAQQRFHQNHDLASIETIRQVRKHPVRKIENSKAIFLSSDKRLCKFNYDRMGHRSNGTVAEAIPDSLLTSILWLKNPKAKISLKSVIAAYSRDLFVSRRVWGKFYETLVTLSQKHTVDDESISTLFYRGFIEDELRQIEEKDIDRIDEVFVLAKIEQSSKSKELEDFKKTQEILELRRITKAEQEKNQQWFDKFTEIKHAVRKKSMKSGNQQSVIYVSIATVALLAILYLLYTLQLPAFLLWVVDIIFGGGGIITIWSKLRKWIRGRLVKYLYNKKLNELELLDDLTLI